MSDTASNKPRRAATSNAMRPAASASTRRSKKAIPGGTTEPASGQLDPVSLSTIKPKASKKPNEKYFILTERMVARAFALLNENVRCKTHDEARSEKGYELIAVGVSPGQGMNKASSAWNSHRSNSEGGRKAREKALVLVRIATSDSPLHPDLNVKLYTSQDGSVIGVPSLGGVETMSFYTKDGVPVTDPARLQELEAERQAAAAAAANAGAPFPAGAPHGPNPPPPPPRPTPSAPAHVAVTADPNAANIELSNMNAEHIAGLLTITGRHEGRLCKVEDKNNEHAAVLSNHDRRIGNNESRTDNNERCIAETREDLKDLRNTLKRLGIDPYRQQPDPLHQLTNVSGGAGAIDSPRASSKRVPDVVPPTTGAGTIVPGASMDMSPTASNEDKKLASLPRKILPTLCASADTPKFLVESDTASIEILNRLFDETSKSIKGHGNSRFSNNFTRSVREYLNDGRLLNDELRKEHRGNDFDYDGAFVDTICAALSRCHSYEGPVWRGQSDSERSRWYKEMLISSLETGKSFEDPAFLSTSAKTLHENTRYAGKKVWIQIQSKTGKFVQPYTSCKVHKSEFEVSPITY